ncbi:MAG: hypothetical protein ACOC04_05740 [Halothece sp.]
MVILRLDTEESAQEVSYQLRGRRMGQFVFLNKADPSAISLAVDLAQGKVVYQASPGLIGAVVILSLTFHGLLTGILLHQTNPASQYTLEESLEQTESNWDESHDYSEIFE